MGRYLIRRTLFLVLVMVIVSLLTFLIFVKLPAGDPARRAVGRTTTPEQIEAARVAFGLDKPLYVQYARFAKGLIPLPGLFLSEDVYYSYGTFVAVKEEIFRRLPVTITLALGAAVIWLAMGIPIGIISGVGLRIWRPTAPSCVDHAAGRTAPSSEARRRSSQAAATSATGPASGPTAVGESGVQPAPTVTKPGSSSPGSGPVLSAKRGTGAPTHPSIETKRLQRGVSLP